MSSSLISVDWLHCVDLGIAQIFLGSLFDLCLSTQEGDEFRKCNWLWGLMQSHYKRQQTESRLQQLRPSMLKGKNHPKLRSKAGECRGLVPFGLEVAEGVLGDGPEENAAKTAARLLCECYNNLSRETFDRENLQRNCDLFSLQYVALSTFAKDQGLKRWPLKPKFHPFQELVFQSSSSPSETWTYRDEGWGGVMATWSFRRGGHYSPAAMANSLFDRFAAQDTPRL